jgi:hypothetical protein
MADGETVSFVFSYLAGTYWILVHSHSPLSRLVAILQQPSFDYHQTQKVVLQTHNFSVVVNFIITTLTLAAACELKLKYEDIPCICILSIIINQPTPACQSTMAIVRL